MLQNWLKKSVHKAPPTLEDFWGVESVHAEGFLKNRHRVGFVFEADGLDASFFPVDEATSLDQEWRSLLRFNETDEIQVVFRKRVEFSQWVEAQIKQAFLAEYSYGQKILLDRLADHVAQMSEDQPQLLSQKILICVWTREASFDLPEKLKERQQQLSNQLSSFGFPVHSLNAEQIKIEIGVSAGELGASLSEEHDWPRLSIKPDRVEIEEDCFRALEMSSISESFTELGMIQSITQLPFPMDVCLRLKAKELRPIISKLERKRNLLNAKKSNRASSAGVDSQIDQIDQVLRSLADRSENVFDMSLTLGLRFPRKHASFQRKALASLMRSGAQMDFCDFEEASINGFDSYLECIPSFSGKHIRTHTVLGSNAIHFLPFFRPAYGDKRAVVSFQTRTSSLYSLDPIDSKLANYNWLVSGTSGSGKSFFVNSLLAQSMSLDPNIFIVDIGGSYNKLTEFLEGRVMSLEPGQGFEVSPFFISKSEDANEERLRRRHIFQVFLEMLRIDGQLPEIEVRHLLSEGLTDLFEKESLPEHPISYLVDQFDRLSSDEARRLVLLLKPWTKDNFFGSFLDNSRPLSTAGQIVTFDLKGLTEFEELSRVVQMIVCASLWAKVRQVQNNQFSWIVLDEVAFSLLKTQPDFVDELVSTLRKYFAGAVIIVQDLEKVTSSLAGSSILQNAQSKAILQQRGNPKNYADPLSLSEVDQMAIQSLRRKKGVFSDIFLIRDDQKTVIRYLPSSLEYWLATTAPQDNLVLSRWLNTRSGSFQERVIAFVNSLEEVA